MYDYEDDYYYIGDYFDPEEARQLRRRRLILTMITILLVLILLAYMALPLLQSLQPDPTQIPLRVPTPQSRI